MDFLHAEGRAPPLATGAFTFEVVKDGYANLCARPELALVGHHVTARCLDVPCVRRWLAAADLVDRRGQDAAGRCLPSPTSRLNRKSRSWKQPDDAFACAR